MIVRLPGFIYGNIFKVIISPAYAIDGPTTYTL